MKGLKWLLMLLLLSMMFACGSDAEMDQNLNDHGNTPGQNDDSSDDDDSGDDDDNSDNDDNTAPDDDQDGVANDNDQCPDTSSGEEADENGCSDSQKDSDGDGVSDANDQCPDTEAGISVNEEGCSDSQADTTAPQVTDLEVTGITPTSFTVEWNLDEGSKGYIRYGASSGNYQDSTAIENDYLTTHTQIVGGDNPAPLTPNTTYYWQIYTEDEKGNLGYWEEQTTKTAEEQQRTYIPDDAFEHYLIDQGLDDVMDDYVNRENIQELNKLNLPGGYPFNIYEDPIKDWTGIQDFSNLEELRVEEDPYPDIISTLEGLESAPALKTLSLWAVIGVPLTIKTFPSWRNSATDP